jgi:hypothetical protein
MAFSVAAKNVVASIEDGKGIPDGMQDEFESRHRYQIGI